MTAIIGSPRVEDFADHPIPGAEERDCSGCGAKLHVAPSSLAEEAKHPGTIHLCPSCFNLVVALAGQEALPVTRPEGADEEMQAIGMSDIARSDREMAARFNHKLN